MNEMMMRNKPPAKAVEVGASPSQIIVVPELESFLTVELPPPYEFGSPVDEKVADVEGPVGHTSSFVSKSSLAIPSTGDLSLGVGVGQWQYDIYPASGVGEFGEFNHVYARIDHNVHFPGPIDKPTSVTVTVDIEAGYPNYSQARIYLNEGSSSSAANGQVGVVGRVKLSMFGTPAVAPYFRSHSEEFLSNWKPAVPNGTVETYKKRFSVSETIYLLPNASNFLITVRADLEAHRAGFTDPQGGFAGVDFRSAYTHAIWPLGIPGGPIHISAIKMEFRRFLYSPIDPIPV